MTADEGMEFASKIQSKSEKAKKEFIRRPAIAHLSAYHNKKGKGEHLNLEKIWLDEFKSTGNSKQRGFKREAKLTEYHVS